MLLATDKKPKEPMSACQREFVTRTRRRRPYYAFLVTFLSIIVAMRISAAEAPKRPEISSASFGKTPAGTEAQLYMLRNIHGMEARITTYGGIVTYLSAPDRAGRYADVVLGYDRLEHYIRGRSYFGALIGRYANRIAKAGFSLNGRQYTLAANDGANSLHGGRVGFDRVIWRIERSEVTAEGPQLDLRYVSQAGEEGYPGTLTVNVLYTLTNDNSLRVDYTATTDQDTVINLTQHSYFNLRSHGDILSHVMQINADKFTPTDSALIPTGEMRSVVNTPFDLRKPTEVGAHIDANDEQLKFGKGYDHNWIINKPVGQLVVAASVYEPTTGRALEVLSTEPGLQFYSGNFLDGTTVGKRGQTYAYRNGFCLEPQHFPDSPNHPDFPSTVLKPGQTYKSTIVYRFSVH